LGNEGAVALASAILATIWYSAQRQPPERRLTIIIDEAHKFPKAVLETMLAEGRKFNVRLVIVTQSPRSLGPRLLDSVLANCDVTATFRAGSSDAMLLDERFPTIAVSTLQRLPKYCIAVTNGEHDFLACTAGPLVQTEGEELRAMHRAQAGTFAEGGYRAPLHDGQTSPNALRATRTPSSNPLDDGSIRRP
jgi:hypothetical protein